MALRIKFDINHNPIMPTIVLANRDGNKIGTVSNAYSFHVSDAMSETPTISFKVTKNDNKEILPIWGQIDNLKLIWCVEWDFWFEIKVELEDSEETIKSIDGTALSQAELSQTNLYDTQINTEDDIAREAYDLPTIIYNPKRPDASLLDRMLEKAPHYTIKHVDETIAKLQRIFEFDNSSLQDCFNEIEDEIHALVVYGNNSATDKKLGRVPERSISLYDLESNCAACGYRGEFTGTCPECGSDLITEGYGEDTTIFICKENLTDDITFSTDVDSVKNCFRLVAGDDLMTATIRNCNPNGSNYIWYISKEMEADMPKELVERLDNYDETYQYYLSEYNLAIDENLVDQYNLLIEKYSAYDPDLQKLPYPMVGYTSLSHALYDVIDFQLYLDHVLMPTPVINETSAEIEAKLLTAGNLSPCAVTSLSSISQATVELNVLAIAKVIVRPTYKVEVNRSAFDKSSNKWTGNFTVTSYSDEEDTADSELVTVTIDDDYEQYVRQKLDKALKDESTEVYDVSSLFKSNDFVAELKKFGLESLETFYRCCQTCLDVLTEQGAGTPGTWDELQFGTNLYEKFYADYLSKLSAIEAEIAVRQSEISTVQALNDAFLEERKNIQQTLNMEKYLGERLWKIFCAYRREDEYENSNYISDGLSNAELFRLANEFIESAQKEIYKSATMQHHISATLKNLLVIKEFEKLLDYFEIGNWMRIECDGSIYKLRLIKYEIDFDNLEHIDVEFSDVLEIVDGRTDIRSILSKADSIASSYDSYKNQASKGESASEQVSYWHKYGLDTTLTKIVKNANNQDILWDEHGLLFREKDYVTDSFLPEQMKIINKTIAITSDAWKTLKTAIGNFYYVNPKTGKLENGYGINGEVIIGKLILGEELGIYNAAGSLTFDMDGFKITNNKNTFIVNPNSEKLMVLSNEEEDIMWVDEEGILHLRGDGAGIDIEANDAFKGLSASLQVTSEALESEISRATSEEKKLGGQITSTKETLSSKIDQTAENITTTVSKEIKTETDRATKREDELSGKITTVESTVATIEQRADTIELSVTTEKNRALEAEGALSTGIDEEKKRATGAENNLSTNIDTEKDRAIKVEEELRSSITITAESITSSVGKSLSKYDVTNYNVSLYGFSAPTATDPSAKDNNGKYYLDQSTGKLYLSNGSTWSNVATLKLITDNLSSKIDQKADSIELSVVSESVTTEKNRALEAEGALRSDIQALPGKLSLSVSGGLGNNASITLYADEEQISNGSFDLSGVRNAFANDSASTTNINKGVIAFSAGTITIDSDNFKVAKDGTMTATGANITGAITATSLTLASGVKIGTGNISGLSDVATSGKYDDLSGKPYIPTIPDMTVYIRKDGTIGSTPSEGATGFKVSSQGLLQASNAIIYGKIYAEDGTFAGSVNASTLQARDKIVLYNSSQSNNFSIEYDSYGVLNFKLGSSSSTWQNTHTNFYGNLSIGSNLEVAGSIFEGETALVNKYAAKSHSHLDYLDLNDSVTQNVSGPISFSDAVTFSTNVRFKSQIRAGTTMNKGIHFIDDSNADTGACIYVSSAQHMYFRASGEQDYTLFYGVVNNTWSLAPLTTEYLNLGTSAHKWINLYAKNGTIQTSDANFKNSISPISSSYESVFNKLRPVTYKFNDGKRVHTGFISQEIGKAMDESGLTSNDWAAFCRDLKEGSDDEYVYSLRYEEIIPLNTHMIQKLMHKDEENTCIIQKLMHEVDELKQEIAELRQASN